MLNHIFSEINIGQVRLKNRLMVSAMVTNTCNEDGSVTERFIRYHEEKAKGGWGLIVTEDFAVEPAGKGYRFVPGLWSEDHIGPLKELPGRIHKYGAKIFAQIYHCGRQTRPEFNGGLPLVAPSPIPCPYCGIMPHELSEDEIAEIVGKFAAAARRAKAAGFDGIELHGGHGYLIAQFMSAYSNKRNDKYGGSLDNRLRFIHEIISAVRKEVGDEFPIQFRISGDEKIAGGRNIHETCVIASILEQWGINSIHVSAGTYGTPAITPPMHMPHGWITEYAEAVRKVVSIPVITVGRINDPRMADQMIATGKADIVAMGRGSLADPYLPAKAAAGDFENIRYCIGCLSCDHLLGQEKHIRCTLNPLLSYEKENDIPLREADKKVFVAGSGPAGMEAARVAALMGCKVELFEKEDHLGGAAAVAAFPPYKGELASFVSWQRLQLEQLNVNIRISEELSEDTVNEEKPDVVIIATGAAPIVPPIPGAEMEHVKTAVNVLLGKDEVGKNIVIIGGGLIGIETAMFLAAQGKSIHVVEMTGNFCAGEDDRIRDLNLEYLLNAGVSLHTNAVVKEITKESVAVSENDSDINIKADNIILAAGMKSENGLGEKLEKMCSVITIGDADSPGRIMDAVRSGYLVRNLL